MLSRIILENQVANTEIILKGVPICRGVAIGTPYFFSFVEDVTLEQTIPSHCIDFEISRYESALIQSQEDILRLQKQMEEERIHDGASIFDAQLQLIRDSLFTKDVEKKIRINQKSAQAALQTVISECQKKFNALPNQFFRERFKDVQDISRRILNHLRSSIRISLKNLPPNSIVFSRELAASDTAEANISCASAFITELGGTTSHAAIVAKARGTPYVSSIPFDNIKTSQHQTVIVDGRTGELILSPTDATLKKYIYLRDQLQLHLNKLDELSLFNPETFDGYPIRLSANIETASELDALHQHAAHGVGLFRSEYLCLSKATFPSEEEQFNVYRDLVEKMHGLPIVIRTFDVGGDKGLPHQQEAEYEGNPFLGCRAIRFLLKEQAIFKTQLRAILRASHFGDVRIMFPMVSTLSELVEAKQAVQEARNELTERGEQQGHIRIGCMIEVPSAAIIADLLAKECDFLSIGTNDLVQYALAVDRSNHSMNSLYTPTHPSVVRMIKLVVQEANHQGIPVTICGEVAADPRFTPLLLGLGVHELSVATRYLPIIKHAIRNTSIIEANQLAEIVLTLPTAGEIQELLTKEYRKNVPDDCFYNIN